MFVDSFSLHLMTDFCESDTSRFTNSPFSGYLLCGVEYSYEITGLIFYFLFLLICAGKQLEKIMTLILQLALCNSVILTRSCSLLFTQCMSQRKVVVEVVMNR